MAVARAIPRSIETAALSRRQLALVFQSLARQPRSASKGFKGNGKALRQAATMPKSLRARQGPTGACRGRTLTGHM
eukprot:7137255-Alexandrium_andersonii.AAC.1